MSDTENADENAADTSAADTATDTPQTPEASDAEASDAEASDAGAGDDAEPAPQAAPAVPREIKPFYWGIGRRKAAIARVRLKTNGSGQMVINKKHSLEEYFDREQDRIYLLTPFHITGARQRYDVFITLKGGGTAGQAGAARLGIARALKEAEPEVFQSLKDTGMLTRDARRVERKKPGQRGARASFQFSKR